VGAAVFLYVQIKLAERLVAQTRAQFLENQVALSVLKRRVAEIDAGKQVELATPASIRGSLVKFEEDFLMPAKAGEVGLIQGVNQLAKQNGVSPSEISFDSIDQKALEGEGGGERGARSLFPGLDMSFTVEGSYADVRRFLMAAESNRPFVIINSLDLKSVESSASGGQSRLSPGAASDQVIAVGIKLSAYYQRKSL
jgi:hypothetical protein